MFHLIYSFFCQNRKEPAFLPVLLPFILRASYDAAQKYLQAGVRCKFQRAVQDVDIIKQIQ